MIINNEEFISDKGCYSRYDKPEIRKEARNIYIHYKGSAELNLGKTKETVKVEGMLRSEIVDMFPVTATPYHKIIEYFHNQQHFKINEFMCINGEMSHIGNQVKLPEPIQVTRDTTYYYRIKELDELARERHIDIKTTSSNDSLRSNGVIKSSASMQEKREPILEEWLVKNGLLDAKKPIQFTRKQVWDELSKNNSDLFRPLSDHTISEFFKNQKLCSFKVGRRKGK